MTSYPHRRIAVATRRRHHRLPHRTSQHRVSSIEVSTVSKPDIPIDRPDPDDDPTGVRALLSALPEPGPMPKHLVARISASLAAEQTQRAARFEGDLVTPLLSSWRRRRGRLLFAVAGAAAAVALVAVASSNLFAANQNTTTSAAIGRTSVSPQADAQAPPPAADERSAAKSAAGLAAAPPVIQSHMSGTRYTRAGFVTQARTLSAATAQPTTHRPGEFSGAGPADAIAGFSECLRAIGASGAQVVQADVAYYEGRPAIILIATTNGTATAYAVGRQCSPADPALLRPATPLP